MCSVLGCDSSRRGAQRFKLPEDPEKRLEWVQFLATANKQRFKESSWTDITICSEHFAGHCVENMAPTGTVRLKPGAAPSLCVPSETDEPLESPQSVEPVEITEAACQRDDLDTSTNAVTAGYGQNKQKVMNTDLNKERAALLQMEGKHVVNESCLLQLFRCKCPSCGCQLQMEKVTCGVLITLNQQCLEKCENRNQWKSQVKASVPTVTPEAQKEMPPDDNPSSAVFSDIVTFSDDESDPSDEGEDGDEGKVSSDGEWNPRKDLLLNEEFTKESEEETEDEGEEEDFNSPGGLKINELCTECGSFFNILKPHTCEHKIKPYSCNICGKRCVTEMSLKAHSKIHDETYEHPCKYCHATFKTRVDKLKHEQIHQDSKDPYKCPDCPETFATSKARSVHLSNHRAPKEFKCGVCGIEFKDVHHLRRHSVVHTGLKPYKCSVCQRGFNQSSHLKSHMRVHTGERPYKCQHCDKCFNHNVSLKSHVQRYHTSNCVHEHKKGKVIKRASDTEDNENKRGTDSEFDNVEEEQDTEEDVQMQGIGFPKSGKRSTGRPRGRPKRDAAGNFVMSEQTKDQRSNTKTSKSKVQKLKNKGSSDEEGEGEQTDSSISFDSEEEEEEAEEEEEKQKTRKGTRRSRRGPKKNNDSDFHSEGETKKMIYSSQRSGKGRPRKKVVV